MNILIIGGGVAAFEAALAASAANAGHKVVVCSKEAVPPYRRPALSRMVAEELSDTAFYFKESSFYGEHNIELQLSKEAVAVNREKKEVSFKDGSVLPYDKLILATGGNAFVPPIPGAEFARTLRDYEDLRQIREELASGAEDAVVIGGGVLGLELADSLLAKGCKVTLLEAGPAVLARNLDQESGKLVMEQLKSLPNLTVKTNARVKALTQNTVELEDETIPAKLIFFSAGVRSAAKLALDAGLEVNRGIVVNDRMQSSDPDIYSCGDAAEPPCGSCGLLSAAKSMGHVAGVNAAGGDETFVPEIYPVRLMALGLKLFSAGKLNDAASESTSAEGSFQRLTRDEKGNLTGIILLGDLKAAVKLQKELHL